MNKTLDINKCSALGLKKAYGRSNKCIYNDALEGCLSDYDMSGVFLAVEAERKAGGNYKSIKDFISRIYVRLRESEPYPNLSLESLARRVSITFPDGDSEKLHYALLVSGHDYHDEIEGIFGAAKRVVENAFVAENVRKTRHSAAVDDGFYPDDFVSDDD